MTRDDATVPSARRQAGTRDDTAGPPKPAGHRSVGRRLPRCGGHRSRSQSCDGVRRKIVTVMASACTILEQSPTRHVVDEHLFRHITQEPRQ